MPHYRKITVNKVEYEYNIGDVNIYIKGLGLFNKEANGKVYSKDCGCGNDCDNQTLSVGVLPNDIKRIIDRNTR